MRVLPAEERAEMVSILRGAKRRLVLDKDRGVCSAIADHAYSYKGKGCEEAVVTVHESILYLLSWIDSMLGFHAWLTSWLGYKGFLGEENKGKLHYRIGLTAEQERKLLATRKAWIDWMIKELEEGR